MSPEPEKKWSRVYELTKHPIIYVLLGAFLTGHIVLLSVPQWSIWFILLNVLLLLGVMVISFILGMGFIVLSFVGLFTNIKMPWPYRLVGAIVRAVMAPFVWFYKRGGKPEPPSETDIKIANIAANIRSNAEKLQREPPTPNTH